MHYYKVGQLRIIIFRLGKEILENGAGYLLQNGTIAIVTLEKYFKVGQLYYKVEQVFYKKEHVSKGRAKLIRK